jgi:trehalose 6-phosphate synthase
VGLIIVSNRLPFVAVKGPSGPRLIPGSGGLVTALRGVLEQRGGRWIGWTGAIAEDLPRADPLFEDSRERHGFEVVPLTLTAAEKQGFYNGFSNEIVWPLFHDFPSLCRFEPRYWDAYRKVNRKYARAVAERARPDDLIWVHDYHLIPLASEMKALGVRSRTAFFLHIPFPAPDLFRHLPWREELLRALLDHDLVGFQAPRDRANFARCVAQLVPGAQIRGGENAVRIRLGVRETRVGVFPISIDAADFEKRALDASVIAKAKSLRQDEDDRKIVLGVDRLDYTKGIPHKLEAFRLLLKRRPDLAGKVTLLQVVVPSREEIPGYRDSKKYIDGLVGEINGQFTRSGWVPIHYIYRSLEGPKLSAYYLAADVAFVTPLKDGMNLVAKEYCASRTSEDGVLVLSEFAGAAAELSSGALLVNPYDVEGVVESLGRALSMDAAEETKRMRALRACVQSNDLLRWLETFLAATGAGKVHRETLPAAVEEPAAS